MAMCGVTGYLLETVDGSLFCKKYGNSPAEPQPGKRGPGRPKAVMNWADRRTLKVQEAQGAEERKAKRQSDIMLRTLMDATRAYDIVRLGELRARLAYFDEHGEKFGYEVDRMQSDVRQIERSMHGTLSDAEMERYEQSYRQTYESCERTARLWREQREAREKARALAKIEMQKALDPNEAARLTACERALAEQAAREQRNAAAARQKPGERDCSWVDAL